MQVSYSSNNVIYGIWAHNMWIDGTGGYAKIANGGIGEKSAVVYFKSQFNRGMSFRLRIYASSQRKGFLHKMDESHNSNQTNDSIGVQPL